MRVKQIPCWLALVLRFWTGNLDYINYHGDEQARHKLPVHQSVELARSDYTVHDDGNHLSATLSPPEQLHNHRRPIY